MFSTKTGVVLSSSSSSSSPSSSSSSSAAAAAASRLSGAQISISESSSITAGINGIDKDNNEKIYKIFLAQKETQITKWVLATKGLESDFTGNLYF